MFSIFPEAYIILISAYFVSSVRWVENGTDVSKLTGRAAALHAKYLTQKARDEYLDNIFNSEKSRLATMDFKAEVKETSPYVAPAESTTINIEDQDEDFAWRGETSTKSTIYGALGDFVGKIITNVKNKIVKRNESLEEMEFQKYNVAGQRTGKRSVIGRRLFCALNVRLNRSTDLNVEIITDPVVVMKLNNRFFYSLYTLGMVNLAQAFIEHGYELRICGGIVRDLLMKNLGTVSHVDMATTAKPDEMREMFKKKMLKIAYTKGQEPHTFVLRIDGVKYRITTLRQTVYKPGLANEVPVTWESDAASRDFTLNGLYLGLDGLVYDYFRGCEDIKNRRVRFIGDPKTRIQQDYMRILRYFRFFGKISDNPESHDPIILEAIKDLGSGLRLVHGSRMWKEFQKLFQEKYIEQNVKKMLSLNLSEHLGLGKQEELDIRSFVGLCRSKPFTMRNYVALTYIGVLFSTLDQAFRFSTRMKLLKSEYEFLRYVVFHKNKSISEHLNQYSEPIVH